MTDERYRPRRRSGRKGSTSETRRKSRDTYGKPRLDPALMRHFSRIGVPEEAPFVPDPFQLEAIEKIRDSDVLVSAPTGSGKTWIAQRVIEEYLANSKRVWYASPLKALSNSLYQDFIREFGQDACGIVTGERKENTDAPIIVGTTEILRNQLYDAMQEGASINADLVILDEAHYLSDQDRGVVWEEVLIYLPSRVRLLMLSATISNADEICAWLMKNRDTNAVVVRSNERPVPLEMLFLFPDGLIAPLAGKRGLTSGIRKFMASHEFEKGHRGRRPVPRYGEIIACLRSFDLLPAIFFLKSRMDCDQAVLTCGPSERAGGIKEKLRAEVDAFLKDYPHLEGHRQTGPLLDSLVASHHAGQLPYWKVLIERMMNKGYLEAIFSTSTVAAGVNFPARTVALLQSDRYNGREFADLTATDLHQMIGRAGRRGKDNIGFALIIPGVHQDPQLIYELKDSPPEPVLSQIRINFSMTLNLLLSHAPPEVKNLLDLSFATFQQARSDPYILRQWNEMLNLVKKAVPRAACDRDDPYEIIANIDRRRELERESGRPSGRDKNKKLVRLLKPYLTPGRLFQHRDDSVYALISTYMYHGRLICAAQNTAERLRFKRGRIRFKKVSVNKIRNIYDRLIRMPEDNNEDELNILLGSLDVSSLEVIDTGAEISEDEEKDKAAEERISRLPCEGCAHFESCHFSRDRELRRALAYFRSQADTLETLGEGLWLSFKRHLRFLKETGFADDADRLTDDGIWASKLRLDHPLLIAEAIKKGAFSDLSPEATAGCIALFIWDRDQQVEMTVEGREDLGLMEDAFDRVIEGIDGIRDLMTKRGFKNPPIPFWPAAVMFLWARGVSWERILSYISIGEGDLASLIIRTADHLRQMAAISETHPQLAHASRRAIDLILREPVYIP
ncbi:MAG: DEAD/DEAH box helicase [Deltaproteobacteria bacterium]|nr:DEAD/DEAH box helicase [Deltaproteobacteria bacterium]